ncbi:MAG: DUF4129 domain-containing protein [Pirellulales bacterium]
MSGRMKSLALVLLAAAAVLWEGEASREGEAPAEPASQGRAAPIEVAIVKCRPFGAEHQDNAPSSQGLRPGLLAFAPSGLAGRESKTHGKKGIAISRATLAPGRRDACTTGLLTPHSLLLTPHSLLLTDSSVDSGRAALDHWWRYPWYDSQTDGIRRIDVREPYDWSFLDSWRANIPWPATAMEWIAWLLLAATLAAITYLLIRAYLGRRKATQVEEAPAAPKTEEDLAARIEALPFPVRRTDGDFLGEARRNYQEANFAEAIVYFFSYQLLELDRNQLIRLARGKTNRQYLRQLAPRRPLRAILEQTMVAFEDVFFGNHPLDRTRFEGCWSRLDEFQSLLKAGVS